MPRRSSTFSLSRASSKRIAAPSAETEVCRPFYARAARREHRAINEVSLFRQSYQATRLRILIDGEIRLPVLVSDGALVATPAGSTAYNLSAQGPIIPINAPLLALTPISPFRPRRWRGALLPDNARVTIEALEAEKRPVAAVADHDDAIHVAILFHIHDLRLLLSDERVCWFIGPDAIVQFHRWLDADSTWPLTDRLCCSSPIESNQTSPSVADVLNTVADGRRHAGARDLRKL